MTKQRAVLELIFAGALWGFGFVATTFALRALTTVEILVFRFLIATFAGEILFFILNHGKFKKPQRQDFKLSVGAGFLLGMLLLLQTIGLEHTTATNSGFITTLYVIIVPVLGHLFFKQKADRWLYFLAILALFGTALLVGVDIHHINTGDVWTLACSLVAALHIIYVGKVAPHIRDSFRFNNLQSFWCFVLLLPLFAMEPSKMAATTGWVPWLGVVFLALGSSLTGFYIQIRTQKVLKSTTASMLFLLESPFAFLFATIFLNEHLDWLQLLGAALIMTASYLTIRWEQTAETK